MTTTQERADELLKRIEDETDREKRAKLSLQLLRLLNEPDPIPEPKGSDTKARIFAHDLNVYSSYMKQNGR